MQTTVLKLSQNEADLASGDGDYVCSLAVPQQLRSGDTIAVAKAYLDTRTAEGTVELPTDTRSLQRFRASLRAVHRSGGEGSRWWGQLTERGQPALPTVSKQRCDPHGVHRLAGH